jgi:hypothetical protein
MIECLQANDLQITTIVLSIKIFFFFAGFALMVIILWAASR